MCFMLCEYAVVASSYAKAPEDEAMKVKVFCAEARTTKPWRSSAVVAQLVEQLHGKSNLPITNENSL